MSLPLDLVSRVSRRMVRGTTWDLASPSQEHPWRKRAKLYCGSGNDLTYRFPVIVEAIAKLRVRSCIIIDGEAVACGDDGLASFDRIRYRQNDASVFMWAFDVIELDGDDLRIDPLEYFLRSRPCSARRVLAGAQRDSASRR